MSLTLRFAARSDVGLIREANEDSVYAGPRLLAVADGMGGMAAGEVASNIVIATLAPLDEDVPGVDLVEALRSAVEEANQRLRHAVEENSALEGMGTTLTGMLFSGNRIAVVHVGDSRAYVYREGELTQITHDDSYVQMLVDEGRITPDEATTHPQRSLLTRALDGREVDPDFSVREARDGDRYLLCSDGLSSYVSAETIGDALALEEPGAAADRLISLALRGGGPDNVTCIVADIVEAELGDEEPVVGGAAAHDRGLISAVTDESAAGRAALAAASNKPDSDDEPTEDLSDLQSEQNQDAPEESHRKTRLKAVAVVGIVAVVVIASAYLGWRYTQQQYYVGSTESGEVAIYRGVHGSIAGLHFSSVVERSGIQLQDLPEVQRKDVKGILTADSRSDARRIIDRLKDQQLPPCPANLPSLPALPSNQGSNLQSPAPTSPNPTSAITPPSTASASSSTSADIGSDRNCRKNSQESR